MTRPVAPAVREWAVKEVVIAGRTAADVGRGLKPPVSGRAVLRWVAEMEAEAAADPPDVPAHMAPPPSAPPAATDADDVWPDDDQRTTLEQARAAMRLAHRVSIDARNNGRYNDAARALAEAGKYMLVIARLEKDSRASGDAIVFSPADVKETWRRLQGRVHDLIERHAAANGLTCAHCGRQISVVWAEGGAAKPTEPKEIYK